MLVDTAIGKAEEFTFGEYRYRYFPDFDKSEEWQRAEKEYQWQRFEEYCGRT